MTLPCAWCESERGVRTKGSHGICRYHELLQSWLDGLPMSIFERVELIWLMLYRGKNRWSEIGENTARSRAR